MVLTIRLGRLRLGRLPLGRFQSYLPITYKMLVKDKVQLICSEVGLLNKKSSLAAPFVLTKLIIFAGKAMSLPLEWSHVSCSTMVGLPCTQILD
jgi:hypothetical protein